jgi:hypothetical protein
MFSMECYCDLRPCYRSYKDLRPCQNEVWKGLLVQNGFLPRIERLTPSSQTFDIEAKRSTLLAKRSMVRK